MNCVSLLSATWRHRLHLRALVKKADLAQTRLTFIVNALCRLYADEGVPHITARRGDAYFAAALGRAARISGSLTCPNCFYLCDRFWDRPLKCFLITHDPQPI